MRWRSFAAPSRWQSAPKRYPSGPAFPTFKVDNARQGFFEPDEFERVLAELPAHLKPVATFAYWTGWRTRSEILSLTWEQVDFAAGEVRCDASKSKGKESRVFPFGAVPKLVEILRDQRRSLPLSKWVFHRHGQPIRDYYTGWREACKRAKLLRSIDARLQADRRPEPRADQHLSRCGSSAHRAQNRFRLCPLQHRQHAGPFGCGVTPRRPSRREPPSAGGLEVLANVHKTVTFRTTIAPTWHVPSGG